MKNLIGNPFEVFLKDSERTIEGILVETDELFDYIQDGNGVCIIPKSNVLYYRTNELSKQSKVIRSVEVPLIESPKEKEMSIFVDGKNIVRVIVPHNVNSKDLLEFIYSQDAIQEELFGRKQKSVECFDNAVYIATEEKSGSQVSFSSGANPTNAYLTPSEMIARLENVRRINEKV